MNPKVLILGKIPPPYYGPAIATEIILQSELKNDFQLIHFDTRLNESVDTIGKFSITKVVKNFSLYFRFFLTLQKSNPNIVLLPISQSIGGFLKDSLYILLARLFNPKVIVHLRGSNFRNVIDQGYPFFKFYVKWIFSFCVGGIVLGNNLRYIFRNYFSENKIFVIPNGANYNFPKKIKKEENKIRVLYLSNLQPAKGIIDFINAIQFIDLPLDNIQFSVYGEWRDDQTRKTVMSIIEENHFPAVIESFTDQRKKLSILKDSSLFVFPPRAPEGHPWVIIEALAAGLPIISTNQGAIRESVLDGYNGYIVATQCPEQIAEKITLLIKDKALREKMSRNSRAHYEATCTESKMVENLKKCFNSLT